MRKIVIEKENILNNGGMNMANNLDLNELVKQLEIVKKEFIKDKELLKISRRNDVIAVELKTILANNTTYDTLSSAIESYINKLYEI